MDRPHTPTFVEQMARQFDRSASSYNEEATVQRAVAERLASRLEQGLPFRHAFEWGAGTGLLTQAVDQRCRVDRWTLNDASAQALQQVPPLRSSEVVRWATDGSQISFAHSDYDLWLSSSALQWLPNPIDFLTRVAQELSPQSRILVATFGPCNLYEIKSLTGQGLIYPSIEQWLEALTRLKAQKLEVEEEKIALSFASPHEVLRHLKKTGVTALPNPSQRMRTRHQIATFAERYVAEFGSDNASTVSLTYHPIYIDIHI